MQTVVLMNANLVFLMGDFNMVPSVDLNRLSTSAHDSPELCQWADTFALTDVWRYMYLVTQEYTCHSSTYKTLSRIDLAFASGPALNCVQGVSVLPWGTSDHTPLPFLRADHSS